ncbi:MAG: pitrilysin family protein [Melioribacteraceae bacterium]
MFDRSSAPEPKSKSIFEIPQINTFTLDNGIEVYFVKKESLPIVYLSAVTSAGSKYDTVEKKGVAYLTSLLIDEGAGEFDSLQLSDEFEKIGSIFNVSASPDATNFSILSLKETFDRSLYLLGNVLTKPRFEQTDFSREKKKVQDRLLQLKDEAGYIASTVFEKQIFRNTFYEFPEIGLSQTVQNITNEDIHNFYQHKFNEKSTKLFIVGNLDKDKLIEVLNKEIGSWVNGSESDLAFEYPERKKARFFIIDKKDSAQSEIRVGHIAKRRNAEDFYATKIMNTILGGQFSSRINLNLRERKGFTYGANSSFAYYNNAGFFEVGTAVNLVNTGEAVKEIFNELNGIRKEITPGEIEFAKSYLIKQYPARFETFAQIAKNIESLIKHALPLDELNRYTDKLDSVTNEEVQQAALNNVFPEESFVVICGEKESVAKQLKDELGVDTIELDFEGNLIN